VDSSTPVSWEEWMRIEKERQRESDRLRALDLARRLRATDAGGPDVALVGAHQYRGVRKRDIG
jgi:hypothetical protein